MGRNKGTKISGSRKMPNIRQLSRLDSLFFICQRGGSHKTPALPGWPNLGNHCLFLGVWSQQCLWLGTHLSADRAPKGSDEGSAVLLPHWNSPSVLIRGRREEMSLGERTYRLPVFGHIWEWNLYGSTGRFVARVWNESRDIPFGFLAPKRREWIEVREMIPSKPHQKGEPGKIRRNFGVYG